MVTITLDAQGCATATPKSFHAQPGDTIRWSNRCSDKRTVRFTSLWPFPPPKVDIEIEPGQTSAAYTAQGSPGQPETSYAYNIIPLCPNPPGGPDVVIP